MLTEIYIEALLVDENLADQVWEAWDKGEIGDLPASILLKKQGVGHPICPKTIKVEHFKKRNCMFIQ